MRVPSEEEGTRCAALQTAFTLTAFTLTAFTLAAFTLAAQGSEGLDVMRWSCKTGVFATLTHTGCVTWCDLIHTGSGVTRFTPEVV